MPRVRRRVGQADDDSPGSPSKTWPKATPPSKRCARYTRQARNIGAAILFAVAVVAGTVAWVVAAERTPAFAAGDYVISFGYQNEKSCQLHGFDPASSPKRVVDVTVIEPGIADSRLLNLRWQELDDVAAKFIAIVEGQDSGSQASAVSIWSPSDEASVPPLLSGPGWADVLERYSHKLVVITVPPSGSTASTARKRHPSDVEPVLPAGFGIVADSGDHWHGGTAYAREMLQQGAAAGLEAAGVGEDDILILGRTHEIPRAKTLRLLQMCDTGGEPLVLATAVYALSFEFRKPNAYRHSPLVVPAGSLLQGKGTTARATPGDGDQEPLHQRLAESAAAMRTTGLRCLTDAGWTCEHCSRDWSKLEPATAASLRGFLQAAGSEPKGRERVASYRALYQALCNGEDPLGTSPLWGLEVMLTAVGLPKAVRQGSAEFAHLLPGKCEGGKGAERLWDLFG